MTISSLLKAASGAWRVGYVAAVAGLCLGLSLPTQAQTAPANGLTSFTGTASGSSPTVYLSGQPSGATAANVGNTGWDFTAYDATPTENVQVRAFGGSGSGQFGALGSGDPYIQCGRMTTTENFYSCKVKANDASAFKLVSVYLTMSATTAPRSITLTGYKAGAAVSGATLTQPISANFSWVKFDVSTNTAFQNIDDFRVTFPTTTVNYQASIGVDEIAIAPAVLPATAPTVTTTAPTTITTTSATLGGNVTADGGSTVTERGVVYVVGTGTPTTANAKLTSAGTTGAYTVSATGLTAATQYTARAYATNSQGTSYGSSSSFSTPAALAASTTSNNISCFGASTGSANVTATGGTSPYTYSWSPSGGTGTSASGLAAGTYTVTVTDATGATTTATATITQPTALTGTTVVTNVSCNGGSNGAINLTPSGGVGGYTFNWGGGITTEDRTGLSAGTYSVTITDANRCQNVVSNIVVTQPTAITSSISSQTNVTTNGGSNGAATVSVSGGTAPYTYSWNTTPVQTTATASGLSAGTYTVTITDANACTKTQSVTITQPAAPTLAASTSRTNVSCFGGSNGTATVSATGGTSPYTYSWNTTPVQTTATATGLAAGTYTVTVTDASSATTTATATITQPTAIASSVSSQTNVACFGGSTGSATVGASGGTPGYTYSWSPSGGTAATASGLAAGTYTVTITDANSCTKTQAVTITQPASALATTGVQTNVTTNGGSNGTATVNVTGGTGSYAYSWNTSPVQTTATASGLSAGTYVVTVTDANGCTTTRSFTITQPAPTPADLTVSTGAAASPTAIAAGTYNNITVTGTGFGQLGGAVVVNGTLLVQSGGGLNTNCQALTGPGSFTLAAGGTLYVCDDNGISASGSNGAVQLTGTRSFSTDASYVYNGNGLQQQTGTGLPATVRNLTIANDNNDVALTQAVTVAQVLNMSGKGNFLLNGQALTLRSDATGTALVVNGSTAGVVTGTTATVQRYLDPSLNPGPGYRHYGFAVNAPVSSLTTATYTPVFNFAYNTSATPGAVTPFPTVFGYDQGRLSTATNNLAAFDKGWYSPAFRNGLTAAVALTVNIPASERLAFTGPLHNGDYSLNLDRNTDATAPDAGWALVGNPYPAPLDWSLVAPADRAGLDAAMYVFESSSQYAGSYRASVNGVGGNANSGSALVASSQAFFVRVSSGQAGGTLNFRNSQRVTNYATQVPMRRGTASTRPLVQLRLQGGSAPADNVFVYAEAGATAGFDGEFDAAKLPNSTGLNLSATTATGQALAIQGLPLLTSATVVPLMVDLPAGGSYAFTAPALENLPATTRVELVDNLTGTRQDLRTLPAAGYAFTAAATHLAGRFSLNLTPAGVLATGPAALAAQVLAYPNPAHDRLTLVRPAGPAASAELVNALGQVVRRFALPTPETILDVRELASGVYVLRLTLDGQPVSKRLVLE